METEDMAEVKAKAMEIQEVLEQKYGKIDKWSPTHEFEPKTTWYGGKYTEMKLSGYEPIFHDPRAQCKYNVRNIVNDQKRKAEFHHLMMWEPFYRCMARRRGTGISQCQPNFFYFPENEKDDDV